MKRKNLLAFILTGFLMVGFSSCGSGDNEGGNVSAATDNSALVNRDQLDTSQLTTLNQLKARITNDEFLRLNYYTTVEMRDFEIVNENRERSCFFGLLDCSTRTIDERILGSETRTEAYSTINHPNGTTRVAVRDHFLTIVNQAADVMVQGNIYYLVLGNGETVNFNLDFPMSANPVWSYNPANNTGKRYFTNY